MTEFSVIDEKAISLVDLKEKLDVIAEEHELSFRAEKTKAYLEGLVTIDSKEAKHISDKIEALEIPRLKNRHIVKILDVMPKDLNSLKVLFSGETLTISDDELKKILDVIPQ
jgi:DNA-directed RNA polymerase subunit F